MRRQEAVTHATTLPPGPPGHTLPPSLCRPYTHKNTHSQGLLSHPRAPPLSHTIALKESFTLSHLLLTQTHTHKGLIHTHKISHWTNHPKKKKYLSPPHHFTSTSTNVLSPPQALHSLPSHKTSLSREGRQGPACLVGWQADCLHREVLSRSHVL